jgi:hypothetical protein
VGSKSTGRLGDYPGSGGTGGGGGAKGKPDETDKCAAVIEDLPLEEVALSGYFKEHKAVPPEKTKVRVRDKLVDKRIAVETESGQEVIGYVPTAYNYLRQCMSNGWAYMGKVTSSSAGKLPKITVDLTGKK